METHDIPIGVIERETGLSKEVLRKWELRYGFPLPGRDAKGIRLYSTEQLRRLRTIKRLMDSGMRAAQAIGLDEGERNRLVAAIAPPVATAVAGGLLDEALAALKGDQPQAMRQLLQREQIQRGVRNLVLEVIEPLTYEIGNAWADGGLGVRHEHLYAEAVQDVLRATLSSIAAPAAGLRILLATPPGELHTLGVLMLQTLLNLHGVQVISLGAQAPATEIAEAACIHRVAVVGVSFSIAHPERAVAPYLSDLRRRLPSTCALWAGGAGAARLKRVPAGVLRLTTLAAAVAELPALLQPAAP